MTAHVVISSVTAVLCSILSLFFLSVARAPGWRPYRSMLSDALACYESP